MAKKTKKEEKQETIEKIGVTEPKMCLVELVQSADIDMNWIIYNLSRAGLMQQYEQELQDYGTKEIKPTITLTRFNEIIIGKEQ